MPAAILGGTRYLRDFADVVSTSQIPDQVIALIHDRHPDRGNLATLAFSAAAALHARTQ